MARSFEVFTLWDEEYDKLAGQLREAARRRRDEMIKIGFRIGAQRQLQERLTNLKEYVPIYIRTLSSHNMFILQLDYSMIF